MNTFRRRGEITTLLLLTSLGVMLAGSFVGSKLTARRDATTSVTQAQTGNLGCVETDGGKNPNQGGAVIATFQDPLNAGQQRQETYRDTCQPNYGSVPILTEYYCDGNVKKQEDLPCTYQAGAGRCTTDSAGFGRCESGLPTVQVVSPGVPTPTAAYTYPPAAQHYIQSVEIVNVTRTQGTFRINGCTGTQNSGQSNAKFWVDGVMVRQPPEYADFIFNRGFPNDCETKTVTVYFNNLTDSQLCSGFGLVANFFYFKNNGTKSNPFNVPPQSQYCPATATPVPPTAVPPTNAPVQPSPTPDTRCGQPGNPACPVSPTPDTRCGQPGNPACPPTATTAPTTCPYTSQAYIEGPEGTPFSQITFSSSSGGGTIAFNAAPVNVGGGRQRVSLPVGTFNIPRNNATARIILNSLPAGYRIQNAHCQNNNTVQSCLSWNNNEVNIRLACEANNLYGWNIERIPCGQTGGPACPTAPPAATATPVPQAVGSIDQMDVNRSYWIKRNVGACTAAGGDNGTCPSGFTCTNSGGTITVTKIGNNRGRITVEKFAGCSCTGQARAEGQCRSNFTDNSRARTFLVMFDETLGDNEDGITCNIGSDRCQKFGSGGGSGVQPTAGNTCGRSCIYSEGSTCRQGNCLDGSQNCSTNVNCGYVPGCSSGSATACPANMPNRQPATNPQTNIQPNAVDINNDGVVSVADFLQQVRSGRDLNGDGRVDVRDLTSILFQLGNTVN